MVARPITWVLVIRGNEGFLGDRVNLSEMPQVFVDRTTKMLLTLKQRPLF